MNSGGIDLLWIPLGADGWFVRFNGRVWEMVQARRENRAPQDLYHSALLVHLDRRTWIIENAWPIPDDRGDARGVVVDGPVFHPWLGRFRVLRYEVRCWPDGIIADASWAVGGPRRITSGRERAEAVLRILPSMPPRVWGRQVPGTHDMWNSNSTIAWVLTRGGVDASAVSLPEGGRAPGWRAGIAVARAEMGG